MIVLYNCPGMMSEDAPQWRALLTRMEPKIEFRVWPEVGKPEEIAALAVYLASDEAAFTTGTCQVIDGGWSN